MPFCGPKTASMAISSSATATPAPIWRIGLLPSPHLYAEGDGRKNRTPDISTWTDKRNVAKMSHYFGGMNLFHISYAAFTNDGSGSAYIRARRYDPIRIKGKLAGTELSPDYRPDDLFATGVPHDITIIKHNHDLFFSIRMSIPTDSRHWI